MLDEIDPQRRPHTLPLARSMRSREERRTCRWARM
jgi:hypothetical protein